MEHRLLDYLDRISAIDGYCHDIPFRLLRLLSSINDITPSIPQSVLHIVQNKDCPNGWPSDPEEIEQFIKDYHCERPDAPFLFSWIFKWYWYENFPEFKDWNKLHTPEDMPYGIPYVYPIHIATHMWFLNSLDGKYDGYLPERVAEDARNGTCKILYHELLEGRSGIPSRFKPFVYRIAEKYNIPLSSFGYLDNNPFTPKLHAQFGIKGFFYNFMERFCSHTFVTFKKEKLPNGIERLREGIIDDQEHAFIHLNRKGRLHRQLTVLGIDSMDDDVKKKILWTFLDREKDFNQSLIEEVGESIATEEFLKQLPKEYDIDDSNNAYAVDDLQLKGYFHFINETEAITRDSMFLSEKTYKAFYALKPFILVGQAHSLKFLRHQGYKTFSPWIDESYDEEINPILRIKKCLLEVERIASMSEQEIKSMLYDMREVIIHNHDHLESIWQKQPDSYRIVAEISNWVNA